MPYRSILAIAITIAAGFGCAADAAKRTPQSTKHNDNTSLGTDVPPSARATALFAGGCFWCLEANMELTDGVLSATSGYTGGSAKTATYDAIGSGTTAHREAVQVVYDKRKVDYATLLHVFWNSIDPKDAGGQYVDRGKQYTTAIYYANDVEKRTAEQSAAAVARRLKIERVATELIPAAQFYPAEDAHQDFYKKNPERYNAYKTGSGRK